jgi:hypothetical protein
LRNELTGAAALQRENSVLKKLGGRKTSSLVARLIFFDTRAYSPHEPNNLPPYNRTAGCTPKAIRVVLGYDQCVTNLHQ